MDKTANAAAIFDKLAEHYQQKYMDVSGYGDSFRLFCDKLPENASVLELACGPGSITRFLLDYRADLKIYATDLAPNMVKLAKKNNPESQIAIFDCRDLDKIEKSYDAVMCGFVLPYLSKKDALSLIRNASKKLNPGGLLYLSTMEDDYSKSGWTTGSTGDKIFMHYHQADYLKSEIRKTGFNLLLETRHLGESGGQTITDLILIGQK